MPSVLPMGWALVPRLLETTGQAYYINALTANTIAFYTSLANAKADTSRVNITGSTTGWSLRYLAYSGVTSIGLDSTAPIAATPGTTSIAFDLNLNNALASTRGQGSGICRTSKRQRQRSRRFGGSCRLRRTRQRRWCKFPILG